MTFSRFVVQQERFLEQIPFTIFSPAFRLIFETDMVGPGIVQERAFQVLIQFNWFIISTLEHNP